MQILATATEQGHCKEGRDGIDDSCAGKWNSKSDDRGQGARHYLCGEHSVSGGVAG